MNDYDDEEESEDESFNDQGNDSESSDPDDEGDSEMIDSELDKKEVKHLQKEVGDFNIDAPRPKRVVKKK